MLFLPKEEGGHGLIHLHSRIATFRLQLIQKLLVGSAEYKWCSVAYVILRDLEDRGLDKTIFFLDPTKLNTSGLPVFYKNLFKVWSLFLKSRGFTVTSLAIGRASSSWSTSGCVCRWPFPRT